MTNDQKLAVQSTSKNVSVLSLFGPPPLISGEDVEVYNDLLMQVSGAVKPSDTIEEIWLRDIVDLEWEIRRWRRMKTSIVDDAFSLDLENVLFGILISLPPKNESEPDQLKFVAASTARKLAIKWTVGVPAATKRVEKLLASRKTSAASIMAATFIRKFDVLERIERMITTLEWRRNSVLREIDPRRTNFADRMRKTVQQLEDDEFESIESGHSPKTATENVA